MAQEAGPQDEHSAQQAREAGDLQALLVEVFALTGQKVTPDDPIVAAALIQSRLIRRAGQEAALAIEQAAQNARQTEPLDHGLRRVMGRLGLRPAQAVLGATLFAICFLASALGNLLISSSCH